jgi:hypothetical protein
MKFRPALLLCIAVLFATAPAWADKVPCCEFAKGSTIGISADVGHSFDTFGKDSFFSFSSSREDMSSDLLDLGSFERFTDHAKLENGWFGGRDKDWHARGNGNGNNDPGPASVPESGTLPMLLLGVTAVGIFARKP